MWLFPESGPKKGLSGDGFAKTVTSHLRSIVPNVQRHMAYFAIVLTVGILQSVEGF